MKRQQSLVIKLTIFISISLIIIWLISVVAATYVSLNLTRHRILENLAHFSSLRMELTNHRFVGAERDAQALAHRYKLYHATPLVMLPPAISLLVLRIHNVLLRPARSNNIAYLKVKNVY